MKVDAPNYYSRYAFLQVNKTAFERRSPLHPWGTNRNPGTSKFLQIESPPAFQFLPDLSTFVEKCVSRFLDVSSAFEVFEDIAFLMAMFYF